MLIKCSECGESSPARSQETLPDAGLQLLPRDWGYYGGFTDNFPWEEPKPEEFVIFCHDCCVRLLEAFPSIAKVFGAGGGHHPCADDTPCCAYAWKATEQFATNRSETLVRTQSPVRDKESGELKWVDDPPERGD